MKLEEYRSAAASTALYPGAGQRTLLGLSYLALGLSGEVSEIAELVELHLGGQAPDGEKICHELGDVLWYDAMLTNELGIIADDDLNARLRRDGQGDVPVSDLVVALLMLGLIKASGQVAEIVKKAIRAQTGVSAEKVGDALTQVRRYIAALAAEFGLGVEQIRAANISKLAARFDTGTIKVHA